MRQGDSLSPILFSLYSQPLMNLFKDLRVKGELTSLKILGQQNLLCQLFADNVGVFLQSLQVEFDMAREIIQVFENILGAFLNVAKSIIIPLTNPTNQEWYARIGCWVLKPGESTIYLGCLIGFNINPTQETNFLLDKVCKCLSHQANKMLSFVDRFVVLCHVNRAMSDYHLISMFLNSQGFEELKGISQDFLQVKNKEGENRNVLVAWKTQR